MITKRFKVYGIDGHRQRESFGKSDFWDFSTGDDIRKINVLREDMTHTNEYVIVEITRNNAEQCIDEFNGQLTDGIFENSRVGNWELID